MPVTAFKIAISEIKCLELPPAGAGRTRNAFVKINFDNFKSYETKPKTKSNAPEFEDVITFTYTTKFADCLSRKTLWLEVHDYNRFTANELLGVARVDLHTLATGPQTHHLALRDGRRSCGVLHVNIVMTQVATVEMRLSDVEVLGVPAAVQPQVALRLALEGKGVVAGGKVASSIAGNDGAMTIAYPDALFMEGSTPDIMSTILEAKLVAVGSEIPLASASLPVSEAHSFVAEKCVQFEVEFAHISGSECVFPPDTPLSLRANIIYLGFPTFAQMKAGLHTEGGIKNGEYAYADIPMKPACHIQLKDSITEQLTMQTAAATSRPSIAGGLGARASVAGRSSVVASRWKAAKQAVLATSRIKRLQYIKDGIAVDAAGQDTDRPPLPLTELVYTPGAGVAPVLSDRLFAGAASLPVCWLRRLDPDNLKIAFENLSYNRIEPELPTESEYVVSVPPSATGPMGIALEPNFSGMQRYGWRSGRRNSGFDIGAVVRDVRKDSYLGKNAPIIRPGHHLISINGSSTLHMTFDETVAFLKNAGRPLVLRFHDPYAVPQSVAVSSSNAATMVAGTWVCADRPEPAPALSANGSNAGTTSNGLTPAPNAPKRLVAQAQQALDMALGALAKVDVHSPLIAAKDDAAKGIISDAVSQAVMVQQALADPGFIRSITSVVTGVSNDMAPANKRKEEDEKDISTGDDEDAVPEEQPQLDDKSAQRALKVMSILTATDEAALGASNAPAYMDGVRDKLKQRAVCMAEMGVFRRTMDSINNRQSPGFASNALKTVTTIMQVYGLAPKDLGLDQTSLIGLQTTMKKENFIPVSTDAKTLVGALADENPDQNGAAFIEACITACEKVLAMTSSRHFRANANGKLYYALPDSTSTWSSPPIVTDAMNALMEVNWRGRILDDGAVVAGPETLFAQLADAIQGQLEDVFIATVLMSATAKLSAHPVNALHSLSHELVTVAAMAGGRHSDDARMAEAVTAFFFNIGRDLENSEFLLNVGAVGRVCYFARAFIHHATNAGGTPCRWAPEGREEEVAECIVFRGEGRYARERNTVRPRLVRTCVNVLINLACYRSPVPSGETSISQIARSGAVDLLGEIMRLHIAEPAVVTSVLNCAANIAFKNRDIQLGLGETLFDAVVLAGYQFSTDVNLLSMALRTIGNLTNQDANIYRGIGYGIIRMISTVMRGHPANISLQNLAASVLSNIASVEAVDELTESEMTAVLNSALSSRQQHAASVFQSHAGDAEVLRRLLGEKLPSWSVAAWMMLEEGGVAALSGAMTTNATDTAVAEACLRTLSCVAADAQVAVQMVEKHNTVSKALFVMRASDFDVGVQLAGVALLQLLVSNPGCVGSVTSSDAAHSLAFALETHKASFLNGIQQAFNILANSPAEAIDPQTVLQVLAASFEGKAALSLQLTSRVFDIAATLYNARAAKAFIDNNSPAAVILILQSVVTLLHVMTRKGFPAALPANVDPILHQLVLTTQAGCKLLGLWATGPTADYNGPMEDQIALQGTLRNDRSMAGMAKLIELTSVGSGEPGDPCRPAVQLRAVLALVDSVACFLVSSPVLPSTKELPLQPGVKTKCSVQACHSFSAHGGVKALGTLLLAYTAESLALFAESPSPDLIQITVRMLTGQLAILLDIVGSTLSPSADPSVTNDPAVLANDPVVIAAGMATACSGAMSAALAQPGLAELDIAPAPTRLMDLSDLAARICAHLTGRMHTGATSSDCSIVTEQEASRCFRFSLARAQEILSTAVMPSVGMAAAQPLQTAEYGYSHDAGVHNSTPAAPPMPPGQSSSSFAAPVHQMALDPALLGELATDEGVCAVWWHEGKPIPAIIKVSADLGELLMFDSKKGKVTTYEPGLQLLGKIPIDSYSSTRVGSIMQGGKLIKQTGFFKSGPKPDRSVCLDYETDTLVQFELRTPTEAEALYLCFEALLNHT